MRIKIELLHDFVGHFLLRTALRIFHLRRSNNWNLHDIVISMILSQSELRKSVKDGAIAFDPPLQEIQWGEASLDLRLGLPVYLLSAERRAGGVHFFCRHRPQDARGHGNIQYR